MTKFKLNGTNCSCGKSFMTEYQANGHFSSHFRKQKQATNRQWVDEVLEEFNGHLDYVGGIEWAKLTINQKINQELEELLESLPMKKGGSDFYGNLDPEDREEAAGYNQAISEVRSIIQAKINGGEKDEGSTKP